MDLLNKVVLITGAKRVGAVVAAHAAARGADVAVSYNHSEREAAAAAAEVRARGRKAMIVKCDVSNADEAATPLGRWGGADEVAKTVLALVDSDFITGETIRVDGGRHIY